MPLGSFIVVATCKTQGCGNVIAFGHRDFHSGIVEGVRSKTSEALYKCGKCGQTCMYRDKDARIEQLTGASPVQWTDMW